MPKKPAPKEHTHLSVQEILAHIRAYVDEHMPGHEARNPIELIGFWVGLWSEGNTAVAVKGMMAQMDAKKRKPAAKRRVSKPKKRR